MEHACIFQLGNRKTQDLELLVRVMPPAQKDKPLDHGGLTT